MASRGPSWLAKVLLFLAKARDPFGELAADRLERQVSLSLTLARMREEVLLEAASDGEDVTKELVRVREEIASLEERMPRGCTVRYVGLCIIFAAMMTALFLTYRNADEFFGESWWGPPQTWRGIRYLQEHRYWSSRFVLAGIYLASSVWPTPFLVAVIAAVGSLQRGLPRRRAKALVSAMTVACIIALVAFACSFFEMLRLPL